jgi:uncharacterized phosphosugar-binding protein
MKYVQAFYDELIKLYGDVLNDMESIDKVADLMLETIKKDAIIHIGGAGGHSQIPSMEMWYRAGGIANIDIMFSPGLGLFDGKPCLERVPGMGGYTMAYHNVLPEDLVIVCNYYGMNAATIDLALAAKKRGATVVGITSVAFSQNTPKSFAARHPSGKNLVDVCDHVLDIRTSKDEQMIKIEGLEQRVGVASTLVSCFVVQLLNIRTAEKAAEQKIDIPLWMCANIPGGDEKNDALLKKYIPRVKHLYPEGTTFSM